MLPPSRGSLEKSRLGTNLARLALPAMDASI